MNLGNIGRLATAANIMFAGLGSWQKHHLGSGVTPELGLMIAQILHFHLADCLQAGFRLHCCSKSVNPFFEVALGRTQRTGAIHECPHRFSQT